MPFTARSQGAPGDAPRALRRLALGLVGRGSARSRDRGLPPRDRPSVPAGAARLPGRVEELALPSAAHSRTRGRRAAARQDDAAAAALLARTVALLAESGSSDPSARLEPLVELGTALVRGGRPARERSARRGHGAVVASGDERAEARMRVLGLLEQLTDPVWWTNRGRTAAGRRSRCRLSDDADAARAAAPARKVHSRRGQQAAAGEALERALELASGAGDAGVEAWIRYWLLQVSTLDVPCERVIARAREDLDWARAHDRFARSRARRWGGWGRCWPAPAGSRRAGEAFSRGAGSSSSSTSPSTSPTSRSRRRSSSRSPPIPRRPSAAAGPRSTSSSTPGRPTSP